MNDPQTMPSLHELKCWPGPFAAMRDGSKRFEFRKDDRNYQVGDILWNREWDPPAAGGEGTPGLGYTGREDRYRVTYKLAGRFGVPEGFCVLSIEPLASPSPTISEDAVERVAHDFCQTCLHIPSWSKLNEADRKHVIDEMRAALEAAGLGGEKKQ